MAKLEAPVTPDRFGLWLGQMSCLRELRIDEFACDPDDLDVVWELPAMTSLELNVAAGMAYNRTFPTMRAPMLSDLRLFVRSNKFTVKDACALAVSMPALTSLELTATAGNHILGPEHVAPWIAAFADFTTQWPLLTKLDLHLRKANTAGLLAAIAKHPRPLKSLDLDFYQVVSDELACAIPRLQECRWQRAIPHISRILARSSRCVTMRPNVDSFLC